MFNGRVAIVTGAGSGLGAALVGELTRAGASVVLAARRQARLEEVAQRNDGPTLCVGTNVASYADIRRLVDTTLETFGRLDIVINNAGSMFGGELTSLAPQEVKHSLHTNLIGPIQLIQAAWPHLCERDAAWVVNVGSLSGFAGMPGQTVYAAGKFGLRGFSEALQREARGTCVHVLPVYPGGMDTEMNTPDMRKASQARGVKVKVLTAERAAERVIKAMRSRKRRLILAAGPDRMVPALNRLFPSIVDRAAMKVGPVLEDFMADGTQIERDKIEAQSATAGDEA